MPVLITGATAAQKAVIYGPWEYSSALFVVAFTHRSTGSGDPSTIGIFKSTDDGDTWSTVGSDITIGEAWSSTGDTDVFGACEALTYPADPWVYVAYADEDGFLAVSRLDLSAEDWDALSAQGPAIALNAPFGSEEFLIMIEQSTDGDFGIMANILLTVDPSDPVGPDRVFALTLSEDLSSWSARTDVASTGINWCAGIARGAGGRVHGLVHIQGVSGDPTEFQVRHLLVRQVGGAAGGTLNVVADGTGFRFGGQATGLLFSGDVWFLFALQDPGIGGPFYSLVTVRGASADSPTFAMDDVDGTSELSEFFNGCITTDGASLLAFYRSPGGTEIERRAWSGSAWGSSSTVIPDAGAGIAARPRNGGFGVIYTLDGEDLWFERLGGGGGGGDTLDQFGRLDSPDQLLPGLITDSAGRCNHNDGSPIVPGPPNVPSSCGTRGVAF